MRTEDHFHAPVGPPPLLQPAEEAGIVGTLEVWIEAYPVMATLGGLALLALVGEAIHRLVRHYVLRGLESLARRSPIDWDNVLFRNRVFQRLAWAVPLIVYHHGIQLVPNVPEALVWLVQRLAVALIVVVIVRAFAGFLGAVNDLYSDFPRAKERPIKGFLQVANVLAHIAAVILVISILMNRDPLLFLSGLGAMTAVIMLVFRDTLLSLVAGIQLTTNDLIRVGDWIDMPQFGADGDVIDIALNSVRVQNWDRTITVIPTHKFLENSFRNWRGMQESGGRRIKRSFYVDQSTIRFLTEEEVDHFAGWELLRSYIERKKEELAEHNEARRAAGDQELVPNLRRLTNVGTLRAYIVQYLREHPAIHREMTFLVRQLAPGPEGLPIEIYVFANDIRWAMYEGVQADIFDHILATVPEFGLRVFQKPSGEDIVAGARELGRVLTRALPGGRDGSPDGGNEEPPSRLAPIPDSHTAS